MKYLNTIFCFQEIPFQENLLLGQYDVCLSNIDVISLLTGDKKKRLMISNDGQHFNDKVKGLEIICKVKKLANINVH